MNLGGNMKPKIPPGSSNSKTHLKKRQKTWLNKTDRNGSKSKFSLYSGPTSGPVIRPPRDPVDDIVAVLITLKISLSSQYNSVLLWAEHTASVWEISLSISSPNMILLKEFLIVLLYFVGTESLSDCCATLYFPIAGPENRKSPKDRLWAKLLSMASLATCAKFFRSWTSFVSLLV